MNSKIKRFIVLAFLAATLTVYNCSIVAWASEGLGGLGDTLEQTQEEDSLGLSDTGLKTSEGGDGELNANDYMPGVNGGDAGTNTPVEETDNSAVAVKDTGNAINDILNNKRYSGAMSSIQKLTNFVDQYFIIIISIVAFFIISAALLKNACAGAYCANSKFWDKVALAHQKSDAYSLSTLKDYFGQQKFMQTSPAGIRDFLLGLVPNIKAFTDFEDADIEPKQYFMRSIPQMIACVIIGIFIYNGYYRDTAAVVGSFGAETFERIMTNADPVALADKLYNTTGRPKTAFDVDKTNVGQFGKEISTKAYSAQVTKFSDINGATVKSAIMNDIVANTNSIIEVAQKGADNYLATTNKTADGAKYGFNVDVLLGTSSFAKVQDANAQKSEGKAGNVTYQIAKYSDRTILNASWEMDDSKWKEWSQKYATDSNGEHTVNVSITFTKKNQTIENNADGIVKLTIPKDASKRNKDAFQKACNDAKVQFVNTGITSDYGNNLQGTEVTYIGTDNKDIQNKTFAIQVTEGDKYAFSDFKLTK